MKKKIVLSLIILVAAYVLFIGSKKAVFLNVPPEIVSPENVTEYIQQDISANEITAKKTDLSPVRASDGGQPVVVNNSTTTETTTGPAANVSRGINIGFVAGDFSYSGNVPDGSTVYDTMITLASTTEFGFKGQYYSGLGYFIQEINGRSNYGGTYWTLYVNGKYSNVGVSQYKLQSGDSVEWKYEKQ